MNWLRSYWRWTTSGSKWRLAGGIGGPIVVLLVALAAVAGEPPTEEEEQTAASPAASTTTAVPVSSTPAATAGVPVPTNTAAAAALAAITAVPSPTTAPAVQPTSPPAPTSPPPPTVPPAAQSGLTTAQVVRVIDGDTIELAGGVRVRYIGIDTPETVAPGQGVACYGPEASARNKALVEGRIVQLEKDVSETDSFGRLLRYVWVDGVSVNEVLVLEGLALSSTYPPDVKYQDRFLAAQQQARDANRGLWAACFAAPPTATTPPLVVQPTQSAESGCHPSYQGGSDRDRGGRVRAGLGDYDCWPGEGNGPNYVMGPVTVVGSDEFQLDTNDADNIGCEIS